VRAVATAIHTAAAMKGGTAALKSQMKQIDLSEIEDGLDDMADLLEETNEINAVRLALLAVCAQRCSAFLIRR
jgi:hypothetical protein